MRKKLTTLEKIICKTSYKLYDVTERKKSIVFIKIIQSFLTDHLLHEHDA